MAKEKLPCDFALRFADGEVKRFALEDLKELSPYFAALESSDMKEAREGLLDIQHFMGDFGNVLERYLCCRKDGLETADFLKTFTSENLLGICEFAQHYLFEELAVVSQNLLLDGLNEDNCIYYFCHAHRVQSTTLETGAYNCMLYYVASLDPDAVARSLQLDTLVRLCRDPRLNTGGNELLAVKLILRWFGARHGNCDLGTTGEQSAVNVLLTSVCWNGLTVSDAQIALSLPDVAGSDEVRDLFQEFIRIRTEGYLLLSDSCFATQECVQKRRQTRCPVAMFGYNFGMSRCKDIIALDPSTRLAFPLPSPFEQKKQVPEGMSVCTSGAYLFLSGGCKTKDSGSECGKERKWPRHIWMFVGMTRRWRKLDASMCQRRAYHSSCVAGEWLLLAGGRNGEMTMTFSVERHHVFGKSKQIISQVLDCSLPGNIALEFSNGLTSIGDTPLFISTEGRVYFYSEVDESWHLASVDEQLPLKARERGAGWSPKDKNDRPPNEEECAGEGPSQRKDLQRRKQLSDAMRVLWDFTARCCQVVDPEQLGLPVGAQQPDDVASLSIEHLATIYQSEEFVRAFSTAYLTDTLRLPILLKWGMRANALEHVEYQAVGSLPPGNAFRTNVNRDLQYNGTYAVGGIRSDQILRVFSDGDYVYQIVHPGTPLVRGSNAPCHLLVYRRRVVVSRKRLQRPKLIKRPTIGEDQPCCSKSMKQDGDADFEWEVVEETTNVTLGPLEPVYVHMVAPGLELYLVPRAAAIVIHAGTHDGGAAACSVASAGSGLVGVSAAASVGGGDVDEQRQRRGLLSGLPRGPTGAASAGRRGLLGTVGEVPVYAPSPSVVVPPVAIATLQSLAMKVDREARDDTDERTVRHPLPSRMEASPSEPLVGRLRSPRKGSVEVPKNGDVVIDRKPVCLVPGAEAASGSSLGASHSRPGGTAKKPPQNNCEPGPSWASAGQAEEPFENLPSPSIPSVSACSGDEKLKLFLDSLTSKGDEGQKKRHSSAGNDSQSQPAQQQQASKRAAADLASEETVSLPGGLEERRKKMKELVLVEQRLNKLSRSEGEKRGRERVEEQRRRKEEERRRAGEERLRVILEGERRADERRLEIARAMMEEYAGASPQRRVPLNRFQFNMPTDPQRRVDRGGGGPHDPRDEEESSDDDLDQLPDMEAFLRARGAAFFRVPPEEGPRGGGRRRFAAEPLARAAARPLRHVVRFGQQGPHRQRLRERARAMGALLDLLNRGDGREPLAEHLERIVRQMNLMYEEGGYMVRRLDVHIPAWRPPIPIYPGKGGAEEPRRSAGEDRGPGGWEEGGVERGPGPGFRMGEGEGPPEQEPLRYFAVSRDGVHPLPWAPESHHKFVEGEEPFLGGFIVCDDSAYIFGGELHRIFAGDVTDALTPVCDMSQPFVDAFCVGLTLFF